MPPPKGSTVLLQNLQNALESDLGKELQGRVKGLIVFK